MLNDGASETTGVNDTRGGAGLAGTTGERAGSICYRGTSCQAQDWELWCTAAAVGRRCSVMVPFGLAGELAEATADRGAARLFFMREKREVTSV